MNRPDKMSAWFMRKDDIICLIESVQIMIKSLYKGVFSE